jgi:beta-galactosidase
LKRLELSANSGWRFYRGAPPSGREDSVARSDAKFPFDRDYDDSWWEVAALPHTVREERLIASGGLNYQGEAWYRRRFEIPEELERMDLLFEMEGVMQRADVWLDGAPLGFAEGGFLPAAFDLTGKITAGVQHVLAIRVDNSDLPDVPPGKPQNALDFCYFGGLYRDAWLKAAGKTRFSYAVHEGKTGSGGLYVTYPKVSAEEALVRVKAHMLNHAEQAARARVRLSLAAPDSGPAAEAESETVTIPSGGDTEVSITFAVKQPRLWHPFHPCLYSLTATLVSSEGETLDELSERIGIRSVQFTAKGFFINGEPLFLSGANRHQDYPYIGFALPDALQKRDAAALRRAGIIAVRTGHYPQDKAFMDACDELGILCVIPTPGWQIHPQSVKFDLLSYENTRRLIRYNRNHPSAALWEPILNETDYPEYFARKQLEIVREETEDGWCACDSHYAYAEHYPVNYSIMDLETGRPLFVREYGDNFTEQFGPSGTLRRVRRGADTGFYLGGEQAMLRSAQERFEDYYLLRAVPGLNGATMWTGVDHNRGYDENEAPAGMLDLFRLPKFSLYLYMAQQDVSVAGPMCFIANYWTPDSPRDVTVYTNCEAVRLSLNGRTLATLTTAEGWANTPIYAGAAYSWRMRGRKVSHDFIPEGVHPPITFPNIPFEPGELTAEALIQGRPAASHTVRTPGAAAGLVLRPHWEGLEEWIADGSDLLMVHVFAADAQGTTAPWDEREVLFSISHGAEIVGSDARVAANPVRLEAGAAGALLRAGRVPWTVTLRAEAEGLVPAEITLTLSENTVRELEGPAQPPPVVPPEYTCDRCERFSIPHQLRAESWYKLNLAAGRPVSASSYAAGYPPENAAKGVVAEPWVASCTAMPQWWACDFEAPAWFYGATVFWQQDGLWYDYDIQVSDNGENWDTVSSGHASGQSYVPVYLAEPVLKRYARVFIRAVSGNIPAGAYMIEFHGRPQKIE